MSGQKETDTTFIGNVIRIIDAKTLIINIGNRHLSVGDDVKIYESLGPLRDLDGSELCQFEHTKDILEVVETSEKYSICKKSESHLSRSVQLALSPLLLTQQKEYALLNVNDDEIEPFAPNDSTIHVGDFVKKA